VTKTRTVLAGVLLGGLGLAAVVASGPRAAAQGQAACGNHWLRGDYAMTIDGTILAGPSPMLLRGVSMTRFDGAGNLSQVDFVTNNGASVSPDWRPATGRYQINADCTGSAEIIRYDGSPDLHLRMVVFDRGAQVHTVVLGGATGSHGVRVQ
jgi:hypothetical protein